MRKQTCYIEMKIIICTPQAHHKYHQVLIICSIKVDKCTYATVTSPWSNDLLMTSLSIYSTLTLHCILGNFRECVPFANKFEDSHLTTVIIDKKEQHAFRVVEILRSQANP